MWLLIVICLSLVAADKKGHKYEKKHHKKYPKKDHFKYGKECKQFTDCFNCTVSNCQWHSEDSDSGDSDESSGSGSDHGDHNTTNTTNSTTNETQSTSRRRFLDDHHKPKKNKTGHCGPLGKGKLKHWDEL